MQRIRPIPFKRANFLNGTLLIRPKATWDKRGINKRTSLHRKTKTVDFKMLKLGLEACSMPDVNRGINDRDSEGDTPLHYTVSSGSEESTILLINHSVDVNSPNHPGRTPVNEAIRWHQHDLVKLLLDYGADPRIQDTDGHTALDHVREYDYEEGDVIHAHLITHLIIERYGVQIPHLVDKFITYMQNR